MIWELAQSGRLESGWELGEAEWLVDLDSGVTGVLVAPMQYLVLGGLLLGWQLGAGEEGRGSGQVGAVTWFAGERGAAAGGQYLGGAGEVPGQVAGELSQGGWQTLDLAGSMQQEQAHRDQPVVDWEGAGEKRQAARDYMAGCNV